ncbi:23S rRNA (adenine(2030)-N(6))-methyltransferase RlmJ [Marivivens marinus]|uniref:23S rRNA (adenine(2030)-N(6))-methyltransferase RlmJ n=1 Tax=Marivivens marinus TaxID=3110173 RepID=UPI003B84B606
MLSYQHAYHAGNMADVHKHAALAWVLDYMGQKPKPLSYFETHAGRGLYDLDAVEAQKTGEAAAGIDVVDRLGWFAPDHPFARALATIRATHGPRAYPGSPLIAAEVLRGEDSLRLAELHPQEVAALREVMGLGAQIDQRDGLELILSAVPPDPGRGVLLVDPSYEVKADYDAMAQFLRRVHRKWPVGVLILWYPILRDGRHAPMLSALEQAIPGGTRHEVAFPPAREGHGMVGSGLFIVNPPYGLDAELARLSGLFASL